jgi:hypothetical protein
MFQSIWSFKKHKIKFVEKASKAMYDILNLKEEYIIYW